MIDSCVMMADTKVARFPYVDKSEIADKIVERKKQKKTIIRSLFNPVPMKGS